MDIRAWQAAVHRVAQSWTQLKRLSTPSLTFKLEALSAQISQPLNMKYI